MVSDQQTTRPAAIGCTTVLRMLLSEAARLGRLRRHPGLSVCIVADQVWLSIPELTDELDMALRALAGVRFTALGDGQLIEDGKQVPSGYLPDGDWIDLAQWIEIVTRPAALAGTLPSKVALKLVRGGAPRQTNVIVCPQDAWFQYAIFAPLVRLDQLAFALNGLGQAVIWGAPSPPIQGVRFFEHQGVAVEAGWTWRPAVDHDVLAEVFAISPGELALFSGSGSWELVRRDDFVRATRSAVRLSMEASHG